MQKKTKNEEDEFQTVPLDYGEDANSIYNREANRNYNSVLSTNNNIYGSLATNMNYDEFLKSALTGLKYNRFEAPKQNFLNTKDLKLSNAEFDKNRIFFDKEKFRKAREKKYEDEIIENVKETTKNKNSVSLKSEMIEMMSTSL